MAYVTLFSGVHATVKSIEFLFITYITFISRNASYVLQATSFWVNLYPFDHGCRCQYLKRTDMFKKSITMSFPVVSVEIMSLKVNAGLCSLCSLYSALWAYWRGFRIEATCGEAGAINWLQDEIHMLTGNNTSRDVSSFQINKWSKYFNYKVHLYWILFNVQRCCLPIYVRLIIRHNRFKIIVMYFTMYCCVSFTSLTTIYIYV